VWIGEDEGQTALLIDGVVQSVMVDDGPLGPGYWPLMVPVVRPHRALILGMGGGTIAHLLLRRFGPLPIVGVERDPRVIHLARQAFGLDLPNVEVIEGDAFAFVATCEDQFDYVAIDLFADGQVPGATFTQPLLRHLRRLLTPGGAAYVNFFKDRRSAARVERLRRAFPRVEVLESHQNLVAVCRAR
jgi:spermidine synthase